VMLGANDTSSWLATMQFDLFSPHPPSGQRPRTREGTDFVMADPDPTARFPRSSSRFVKAYAPVGSGTRPSRSATTHRPIHQRTANLTQPWRFWSCGETDTAIGQRWNNEAVEAADEVVDIYKLVGVETPGVVNPVRTSPGPPAGRRAKPPNNLLRRLLNDQIKTVQRDERVVQSGSSPRTARRGDLSLHQPFSYNQQSIIAEPVKAGQRDARRGDAPRAAWPHRS